MPTTASLHEMVDLALGTPEVGCVNYTVLHRLLHAVLHQLQIGNVNADLPEDDEKQFLSFPGRGSNAIPTGEKKEEIPGDGGSGLGDREVSDHLSDADSGVTGSAFTTGTKQNSDKSIPITRTPYHQLEEKVQRLEQLWRDLNALPSSSELLERAGATSGGGGGDGDGADYKPKPVAEMWQSMQLSRKVDANTQGVSKLMSLVEDLLQEIQALKQANSDLKRQMDESTRNDERFNDILAELEKLRNMTEECEQKMKDLSERVPTDEVMGGFVSWSALEDYLKGLKENIDDQKTSNQLPDKSSSSSSSLEATNEETSLETTVATEITMKQPVVETGNQTDPQSRPTSRYQSRSRMSTPGPSAELQDLLERLGKLTDRHEILVGRVDQLELELGKKADSDMLKNMGLSEEINEQMWKMLEDIESLKQNHLQDEDALNRLQLMTQAFQAELEKLSSSIERLKEESINHQNDLESLFNSCKDLNDRKADKEFVQSEVDLKADKENLEGKVNRSQFEVTCDEINQMINDLLEKLLGSQGEWKFAMDQLNNDLDGKLDRLEFGPYRDELEKQLRALAKKMAGLQAGEGGGGGGGGGMQMGDDAAGIRRQLIQRFHCISCDKPVDMMPQKAVPSLPAAPGLPENRSMRPYTVYELDQIRQQQRNLGRGTQYTDLIDLYATSRACGGSHTLTFPHRRLVRMANLNQAVYGDDAPQPPTYRSETDIGKARNGISNQSASTSRLPNVYPTNRSTGKPLRQYMEPPSASQPPPPPSQSIRPTSAQLSLRPVSSKHDSLMSSRSKTQTPIEMRNGKSPTPSRRLSNGEHTTTTTEVHVNISMLQQQDDLATDGSSINAFPEVVPESSAIGIEVNEVES